MWIEAIIPAEDLRRTLAELAPLKIRLGDEGGELALEAPSEMTLVPDKGVRIVCVAQLHWPVLGVSVPVTMKSLIVLLRPVIETHDGMDALVFKLEIEHADFAMLPAVIDTSITSLVNEELAKKHVELSWRYAETLSHVFRLPDLLEPAEALALTVTSAVVKITTEALGLAISLRSDVRRGGDAGPKDTPSASDPPPTSKAAVTPTTSAMPLLSPAALAVRGLVAAVAFGAIFALGRASRPRSFWLPG
jgi:hypothetical protein